MERIKPKRWFDEFHTTNCVLCGTILGISFSKPDVEHSFYCNYCVQALLDLLSHLRGESCEEIQESIFEQFLISRVPFHAGTISDAVRRLSEKGLVFMRDGKRFDLLTGREIPEDSV